MWLVSQVGRMVQEFKKAAARATAHTAAGPSSVI